MAFTKIQPHQVVMPTFFSVSGDITGEDLVTGIDLTISRELFGEFDFVDSLTISSREVITTDLSNYSSTDSITLAGSNNTTTGYSNIVVNGVNNTFSGHYNTLVNGVGTDFGQSGRSNTILAGYNSSFGDRTTGAVILADHETTVTNNTNHSLLCHFASGIRFAGASGISIETDIRVAQNRDALFSGDAFFYEDVVFNTATFTGDVGFNTATFTGDVEFTGDVSLNTATFTGDVEFTGDVNFTGNDVLFTGGSVAFKDGQATFYDNVVFYDPVVVFSSFALSDSSEAASQRWAGEGRSSSNNATLNTAVETQASVTNLKNLITGSSVAQQVATGYLLTGLNGVNPTGLYVMAGNNFTGTIGFDFLDVI